MRWARRIAWIALFILLLVGGWRFAAQNSQVISIDYLVGRFEEVTVWLALLCAFAAGLAVAALAGLARGARLRLEARRYRKAARDLEAEVHQLRNLPLSTEEIESAERPDELASLGGVGRGG
jgi:uncharacterized integral membrane protein